MAQNLEIEFKNILTKTEYQALIKFFRINDSQIFSQENHYFDTQDFSLKKAESALRIRKKQYDYEMTLKQPANFGLLETNQPISQMEAELAIKSGMLPAGLINEKIEEMGVPFAKIKYFGSLKTDRTELEFKGGLLVLDHSCYLDKEDFELEYEVKSYQEGEKLFKEILEQFQIPARKTKNKIQRFYEQKYSQKNEDKEHNGN